MCLHFNYHVPYKDPSLLMVWETGSTQGGSGVIREDEVGPGREGNQEPWQNKPSFSSAVEDTAPRLGGHWKKGETGGCFQEPVCLFRLMLHTWVFFSSQRTQILLSGQLGQSQEAE